MANPTNGAAILNGIRDIASQNYRNNVPVATASNLSDVGNPIIKYQSIRNEFLELLVNKIALPIMDARSYRSPLAFLKREGNPLTATEEEIGVNPAKAKKFNAQSTDLLAQTIPDVKVAYHTINRQDRYDCTIQYAVLRGGFTSWGGFDRMVEEIVQSLYNGNYIDEFEYTKNLLAEGVINNTMKKINVAFPVDATTDKAFVKQVRTTFMDFKFPSTDYNAWGRMIAAMDNPPENTDPYTSWCDANNVCVFVRADILSEIDVEVLASAFNMDKADFMGKVVPVNNFGSAEGADNIYAIMCDRDYPRIWNKLYETEDFRNGSNLSTNYYLHVWQIYSTSPLKNAVAFGNFPNAVSEVDVSAENANRKLFGVKVSDMQTGVRVNDTDKKITGTLKYMGDDNDITAVWGYGNFIALKFYSADWSDFDDVKVGLDPSQGSGLVSILNDPDKNGVFKITDKDTQKFVVAKTVDGVTTTDEYDLTGLIVQSE